MGVELGQVQNLHYLLANPLVIGDGIGAAGDEEGLEEFREGRVESLEGLEIEFAPNVNRDVVEVIAAVTADRGEAFVPERFRVIGQPFLTQFSIAGRALPEGMAVDEEVADLELEAVRSGGPTSGLGVNMPSCRSTSTLA